MNSSSRVRLLTALDHVTAAVPYTHSFACHRLFDLAAAVDAPQILEVACGYGKATTYLAAAARQRRGQVLAVDSGTPRWMGRTAEDLLAAAGVSPWCQITFNADARWYLLDLFTKRPTEWLDLVYVDASHSVEADSFVALAAWVHLRPGGVLVLDDLDWTAAAHGDGACFSQPTVKHVRIVYDYIRRLKDVARAYESGREEVEWSWGFLHKRAAEGCDR